MVGKKATAVFRAIIQYKVKHDGASPSVRDLAAICGYTSTAAITYHLNTLESAGLIRREPALARIIRVTGGEWRPPETAV